MTVSEHKKKLAIIGMTTLMILVMSGCMRSGERKSQEMLAHMYEKYGVEFEIINYIPVNVDCSYDVWLCDVKQGEPSMEPIEVHRYSEDEYIDNYYTELAREEIESRAMKAILQVADEGKVYLSSLKYAEEEYRTLEQLDSFLLTDRGQYAFSMFIYIKDCEKEGIRNQDVIEKLLIALQNGNLGKPRVRVFFIKNDEIFKKIDRESHLDMIYWNGEDKIYTEDYSGNISEEITK